MSGYLCTKKVNKNNNNKNVITSCNSNCIKKNKTGRLLMEYWINLSYILFNTNSTLCDILNTSLTLLII